MSSNTEPPATTRKVVNDFLVEEIQKDCRKLKYLLEADIHDETTLEDTRKEVEALMKRMNGPQELRIADTASSILGELVEEFELACPRNDCAFSLLVFVPATTAIQNLFDQLQRVYCTACLDTENDPYLSFPRDQPVSFSKTDATTSSEEGALDFENTPVLGEATGDAKETQKTKDIAPASTEAPKVKSDPSPPPNLKADQPKEAAKAPAASTKDAAQSSTSQHISNKPSKTNTLHNRESSPDDTTTGTPVDDPATRAQTPPHSDSHTNSSIEPTVDATRTNLGSGLTSRTVATTSKHHGVDRDDEVDEEGSEARRARHARAGARLEERGEKCLAKEGADG